MFAKEGNNFLVLPLFSSQIASGWRRHNEQELGGTFPPSFGASGSRGVTHKQGNTKKTKMQKCKNEPELKATFPLSFGAWSKRGVRQKQEMQNDKTSN